MWASLMVNPTLLPNGDHTVFMSGINVETKGQTADLLHQFGWKADGILDLGDISTARRTEMLLPVWLRTWVVLRTAAFNFKIAPKDRTYYGAPIRATAQALAAQGFSLIRLCRSVLTDFSLSDGAHLVQPAFEEERTQEPAFGEG